MQTGSANAASAACALIGLTATAPVAADTGPAFSADVLAEIQYENGIGPDSSKPRSDFLFSTVESALFLGLSERVAVESVVLLELVDDPPAGEDSIFRDHGLFAENLMLAYHGDSWSLFAGKFNAAFGIGWDLGAGVWGVDFPEDYEVAEKVGFAVNKTFGHDGAGWHTLHGSLYQADRTALSGSLIEERGRLRLADGGATNTKNLKSFTLSLTGEDMLGTAGLGYHFAYRSHAHGDMDLNAVQEDGFAAAVFGLLPMGDGIDLEAMAEAAYINNVEGSRDDASYLTLGGTAYYGGSWNTAFSVTFRTTHLPGGTDIKDHRFQATSGFVWESGVSFDLGYRYSREGGADDHTIGFLMAYEFSL